MSAGQRRWQELTPRARRILIIAAAAEGALKTAALIDLARRPATEIRGPKWMWAAIVALINAFGAAPLAYFVLARRHPPANPT